ncbi:MAG: mechanosensitive ion channel [Candidatus Aenigmarchaeota archaeon]|nr:mechanosensitive ion channel [Candidatus Aenigmarchaeota archaeon]
MKRLVVKAGLGNFIKAAIFAALLVVLIGLTEYALQTYLKFLAEYKPYLTAGELVVIGYLIVENIGWGLYKRFEIVSKGTASIIRTITRVAGYGIILSSLTSVFNVNPAAALTIGSFSGLVIGFAFQNVLGNAIAGIFIVITRPFKIGDMVEIKGIKGRVHEIGVMRTTIDTGEEYVLIPSSSVVAEIIKRRKVNESS